MALINDRIKDRRQQLGLTLLQVADFLGVKEATAQRYESGDIKNIKHETVLKLSIILKCNPAYLMGWIETPNTAEDIKPAAHKGSELSESELCMINLFRIVPEERQGELLNLIEAALRMQGLLE